MIVATVWITSSYPAEQFTNPVHLTGKQYGLVGETLLDVKNSLTSDEYKIVGEIPYNDNTCVKLLVQDAIGNLRTIVASQRGVVGATQP